MNDLEITLELDDAVQLYKYARAYYWAAKQRGLEKEEELERIKKLIEVTKYIIKQRFLMDYEDHWDYTFDVLERGLLLQFFIEEVRPDYRWLYKKSKPCHISELPDEIKDEFLVYLKKHLAEHYGVSPEELKYSLDDAIEEYIESSL